jgi:hypothetical protein
MPDYANIPVSVTMSQYGYWTVTIAVAPGRYLSVMIVRQGISPAQAISDALLCVPVALPTGR